jgi:hypothetical protein
MPLNSLIFRVIVKRNLGALELRDQVIRIRLKADGSDDLAELFPRRGPAPRTMPAA